MSQETPPSAADGRSQFGGFVVVGILSTACNLASRYLFEVLASYEVALAGANIVGVLSAFFMNRWLFSSPAVAGGSPNWLGSRWST